MSTPPPTPPNPTTQSFDITTHYHNLLTTNPTLTPPIAAIESLISLLSTSPITTVSETLSLISHASTTLLKSQRNPIPVSAGTDLFQRYLITSFQNYSPSATTNDFTHLRNQLITNSKVFVARAKSARTKIASHALPLIRDEGVVITYGSSRVVASSLMHAADAGRWFRVVQVMAGVGNGSKTTSERIEAQVSGLRKAGIEVATVSLASLSYVLHSLPGVGSTSNGSGGGGGGSAMVILGTSAVLENGAAVSEMGCYLVSQVARAHGIPLYIATESYKFARQFPVGYGARDLEKMGTKQDVVRFTVGDYFDGEKERKQLDEQSVDITPPGLITGLITENGVMTPNAVAEELIKLWF